MQHFIKKLKILYLPFLIIAISFIVLYTFLNWLFFIKTEIFTIKEIIRNFGLPFVLSWVPVLIWLRPRINLLKLKVKERNDSWSFFYQFAAVLVITIPTIIAQNYVEKSSGKLTQVTTIGQIKNVEKTKYYKVKKFYIDKKYIGVQPHFESSGRHNEDLKMDLYAVLPVFNDKSEINNSDCFAWLGINYSKTISNRLSENEKEKAFQNFIKESEKDFDRKNVNEFVYLERSEDNDEFRKAVQENPKYNSIDAPVLLARNEPFENRTGDSFLWIFFTFGIGSLIWLIMILIPKFNQNKLRRFENGNNIPDKDLKDFIELLKPQKDYLVTQIIIFINILIFVIMVFSGLGFLSFDSQDLLKWGANFRPLTTSGEWWRLLTNIFLHGGLMHILSNIIGLIMVGFFLEPLLGRTKYLLIYIITGIIASCISIWWYNATVSVGASGAVFGLYGVFLTLLLTKIFPPDFSKSFLITTLIFIAYNLLMGLTGGIDNAAHIGGLISGLIIGIILAIFLKRNTSYKI
jgi:rhomboid protease GluP